jgi:hypothetical protein
MKGKFFIFIFCVMALFMQGCAVIGTALSLGAAYGISQLAK